MKSLGAIVCVALMMVPFVGTSAPAENESLNNAYLVEAMRINAEITGHNADLSNAKLLGSGETFVPAGSFLAATYDIASGEFSVGPVPAPLVASDTTTQHGCIVPSTSGVGYGYTKPGPLPPTGDYQSGCQPNFNNFYEHPGGVSSLTLVAQGTSQFSYVYTFGYNPQQFAYAYMYVYCTNNSGLTVHRQMPPPPNGVSPPLVGTSVCYAYGFNSGGGWDPAGVTSYGFVYHYPPGGETTYGLVNY